MCLKIKNSVTLPETQRFPVYKLYYKLRVGYKSYYRDDKVNFEENPILISSRKSVKRQPYEEYAIDYGLHVYLNLEDALEELYEEKSVRVIELIADKKWLVGVGIFAGRNSAVFHKLKFNRVVPVKRK